MEDLRRSYSPSQLEYMRRQIEGQWKRRRVTAADDAQAALEAVVEKVVIGAALTPLECGYAEVLERLGVTGQQAAVPALWLAHAIAELGSHNGPSEFLELLEQIWAQITRQSPA